MRARLALALALALAACAVEPPCEAPVATVTDVIASADPIPELALARGPSGVGLAWIVRPPWPRLAQLEFARVGADGVRGAPVTLWPVDQAVARPVTITHDGTAWVACTAIVGGAPCFAVDDADAVTELGMVLDATSIAITHGVSGTMAAWSAGGELRVGVLGGSASELVTTTDAIPVIAATERGYAIAWADGDAFVATLDAAGRVAVPVSLGPAVDRVSIAADASTVAVAWIDPAGNASATLVGRAPVSLGPATRVAVASGATGLLAAWATPDGEIEARRLDRGPIVAVAVPADAALALALAPDGDAWLLATSTHLARIGCP